MIVRLSSEKKLQVDPLRNLLGLTIAVYQKKFSRLENVELIHFQSQLED